MTLEATVINGQIVLDQPQVLPEGAKVKVEIRQFEPAQDEWLRRLRGAASDCGVSLSNKALGREEMYD